MREASGRVVDMFVDQMRLGGLDVAQLTSGLGFGPTGPTPALVDWNTVVTMYDRAGEAAGGLERLSDLCSGTFTRAFPEGYGLMQLTGDATSGTEFINAFVDASFFTHLRYPIARTGDGELRLSVTLPKGRGHKGSRAFFHALTGELRAASLFLGLPESAVRARVSAFSGDYELTIPKPPRGTRNASSTIESRVRAKFLRHFEGQLANVRRSFEELHRTTVRAVESSEFEALSAAVARGMVGQERQSMPTAALEAIRSVLGCRRVAMRVITRASGVPVQLAAVGPKVKGLVSFESEGNSGAFVLEASVQRDSPQAAALRRLLPWLVLIFDGYARACGEDTRTNDWAEKRLDALAMRWNLTVRQRQVAWLIAQGDTNKGIAATLACSEGTVELHTHAIMAKSGFKTRAALAAHFYRGN
jgi:DNA-binding CsgD family transcriptional regulator